MYFSLLGNWVFICFFNRVRLFEDKESIITFYEIEAPGGNGLSNDMVNEFVLTSKVNVKLYVVIVDGISVTELFEIAPVESLTKIK